MGRARGKLTIKHIEAERARKLAFNQRNNNLAKKVSEFSRKFGVEACLIVYDGEGRPTTTPQDSTIVRSMLEKYELQKIEGTTPKIFDVKDYFADKKNKVEGEISKVHKEIVMKMYPTLHPCFQNMEEEQLKTFIAILDGKIQACNHKISMLKKMQQSDETSFTQNTTDPLNSSVLSTNQSGEFVKLDDVMAEPREWTGEPEELNNFVAKPVQEWLAKHDWQQSETSFTQNTAHTQSMAQERFSPSNSNQSEGMHDGLSQWQPISDPLNSSVLSTNQFGEFVKLDDVMAEPREWTGKLGELEELNHFVAKPNQEWLTKLDEIGEMDFTNHVDVQQSETGFTQNTAQERFYPSNSNQSEGMHDGFSQWQPISDPLKSPVSFTNQLAEAVEFKDLMAEAVEFKDLMAEPGEWADHEWFTDTELLGFDDRAASKLDDGDDIMKLISQDDVFAWKDDFFLSQNEEQYATLEEGGMSNKSDFGLTDKTLFQ